MRNLKITALICALAALSAACEKKKEAAAPPKDELAIKYTVRTQWVHDNKAFTEGLLIHEGKLYESTGQDGSWIGIVDINNGTTDKKVVLDDAYFGEGITILNNKVYWLTWQNKVGFIYDLRTFRKLGEFTYDTEGWGLTHDSTHLIMSDGTETLTYLDTVNFKPVKKVKVTDEYGPVKKINELEYVDGYIFANQWETNWILKIDPATGKVVGRMDLTPLARDAKMRHAAAEVLNGIAYHPTTKLLLVTGKFWPLIYVLKLNG